MTLDLTQTKSLPNMSKLLLERHHFEIGYLVVHEIMTLKKIGRLCFHHFNSIVRICQNLKGKSIDTMHMCNALDKTKSYLMLQCTILFMDRNRKSVSTCNQAQLFYEHHRSYRKHSDYLLCIYLLSTESVLQCNGALVISKTRVIQGKVLEFAHFHRH